MFAEPPRSDNYFTTVILHNILDTLLSYEFVTLLMPTTDDTARPFSISLAPLHEKEIERIERQIRLKLHKHTNRSEAVQIALLYFKNDAPIADLVKKNQQLDKRRKR